MAAALAALTGAPAMHSSATAAAGFTFAAGGDHGSSGSSAAVLRRVGGSGLGFFLSLGDLSYESMAPAAWCQFVKDNLNAGAGLPAGDPFGESYPFPITEGNHDVDQLAEFVAPTCLPDRMEATVSPHGSAGREYFFDYPRDAPLARFIVTSPGVSYSYNSGSSHYQWLSDTIDAARAAGIGWVIVANHRNYISTGGQGNQVGGDFFNLLVRKRVDLVLQGHEHMYQRSKQLALGPDCSAVPTGTFRAGCVADSGTDGGYPRGAGTVLVVDGTAGEGLFDVNSSDPEAGYFARTMGSNQQASHGFSQFSVTAEALSMRYVSVSGGFTDGFSISVADSDVTPPSVPSGVTGAAPGGNVVELGSDPATDDRAVTGYRVRRDGVVLGQVSRLAFRDEGLVPGSRHTYTVEAVDAAGNVGRRSGAVQVVTPTDRLAFYPVADATISAANRNRNYGAAPALRADGQPVVHYLMRFAVTGTSGRPVRGAVLRSYVENASNRAGEVLRVRDYTWSEGSVTWATAPVAARAVLASPGSVPVGSWVTSDLSVVVTDPGRYSLRVRNPSTDAVQYTSKEGGLRAPRLIVRLG